MLKKLTDVSPRIEKIIVENSTDRAIIRLNGYLKQYYWNAFVRESLGTLYLKIGRIETAGKLLYFKKEKNEQELAAVEYFKSSVSHNPTNILKKIIGNNRSRSVRGIKGKVWFGINQLILEIVKQEGEIPKFVQYWIKNVKRIRRLEKKMLNNHTPYLHNAMNHVAQSTPDNPLQ